MEFQGRAFSDHLSNFPKTSGACRYRPARTYLPGDVSIDQQVSIAWVKHSGTPDSSSVNRSSGCDTVKVLSISAKIESQLIDPSLLGMRKTEYFHSLCAASGLLAVPQRLLDKFEIVSLKRFILDSIFDPVSREIATAYRLLSLFD